MINNHQIILSDEQNEIVKLSEGQHLVLSPPGTGKTELLAQRVSNALRNRIVAEKMICLTFTNRAAKGMKERIEERYPNNEVFIGNIHHFSSTFLFKNKLIPQLTSLLDEEDSDQLLEEAKQIEKYNSEIFNPTLLKLGTFVKQKNYGIPEELLLPPRMEEFADIDKAISVCKKYESLKGESYLIDFDDLLTFTYLHLSNKRQQLLYNNYDWIQVDEVQDLNPLQWAIIKLIASPVSHKVFFGDYEQSIFSFMGARLERLHKIEKECTVHNLQKNFRSPSYLLNIFVKYAETFLSPKWKKQPFSNSVIDASYGDLTLTKIEGTNSDEAEYIVNNLITNEKTDIDKQTAILVRSNRSADLYSRNLSIKSIDHFKISGFDLFRRKLIKDIIAFLSVAENEYDRISWIRMFNVFGKISTLKESRKFINSMISVGLFPVDIVSDEGFERTLLKNFVDDCANNRVVIFDTETTGLDTEIDEIIQIAAVEFINGKPGKVFEVFIKTEKELGESEKIHNISKEILKEKGLEREIGLEKFIQFLNNDILIAHNLNYDWNILQSNLSRAGFSNLGQNDFGKYDTLEIARRLYPKLNSFKLIELLSSLEIEGVNSHNALDDVLATANLLDRLIHDSENLLQTQNSFVISNEKVLTTFRNQFCPIWNKFKSVQKSQTSFQQIIDDFIIYLQNNIQYQVKAEEIHYLNKLKRHMEIKCGSGILNDLLKKHIPEYKLYKESDLIIGDEKIIISTVHKAKGLEFYNVIIPECVEGVYPFWNSKKAEEINEDARILYVALSRAKKKLDITYHTISVNAYGKEFTKQRSRFLDCIENYFEKIIVK